MKLPMRIEYLGIHIDPKKKNSYRQALADLYEKAPSDSFISLTLERGRRGIHASGRIASKAGVFVENVDANEVEEAMNLFKKQMFEQLDQWKQKRFSPQIKGA